MHKIRRFSGKLAKPKPTLKTNKRKSLRRDTPLPKLVLSDTSLEVANTEDSSDLESDINLHRTEGQFITAPNYIDKDQIRSGVKALFECILKDSKNKNELFEDEKSIFLQITAVKIPNAPIRQIRLSLKHSLLSEESDICLIVKDIGNPKDYDGTIEHYQKHLLDHDITRIKTIIPYHQFKSEYGNQFELKRKLLGLYDHFLVDGRISSNIAHSLGKIFLEKRKMPTSIKMNASNLKDHVEKALKKTIMKAYSKGDSYLVQVGHSKMLEEDVFENICEIVDELSDIFPGRFDNVRQLGLKTATGVLVPIYLTLKNQNTVNVTMVRPKLPKEFKSVTGELSTYLKKDVTVLPSGKVIVTDKNKETKNSDEDIKFLDSDFLDESLFKDDDEAQYQFATQLSSDSETEEIAETRKKGNSSKRQIQNKKDQSESEEHDLIEAEQMYLSEYEQKKLNTTEQKGKGKGIHTSLKVGNISTRKNPTKNQVNKLDLITESNISDEDNKDIGENVLKSSKMDTGNGNITGDTQINQQSIKGSKKKVKPEESKDKESAKAIKTKPKTTKESNSKKNKELLPEAVQTETQSTALQVKRTGRLRKKRDSPLKNEDASEKVPPKKSRKMPVEEIPDVAENQAPKKKQTKTTTQTNRKRKNTTENYVNQKETVKADVKQARKGKKKGNVEKNEAESNLLKNDNAQKATVSDNIPKQKKTTDIENDVNSRVTRSTRNKKLEDEANIENKRPTRKQKRNIETEIDDTAKTSKQKTTQNKGKQRQKKQVEEVLVEAPVPTTVQKGKKIKANNATNEIPKKNTKKVMNEDQIPEIKNKNEKSETVSRKKNAKDKVETNKNVVEKKKVEKDRKLKNLP